jgi:AraC family transcriptional regulator, L-rhamnose operon transcriptional activator RhaR
MASVNEDLGLERLTFTDLFPTGGPPIHVNRPLHQGDIPLHDHDFLELAVVTDGQAVHRTIHGQEVMKRGDCVLLSPGQWHAWEQCHDLWLFNCCFGTDLLLRELAWVRTDPLLVHLFPSHLPAVGQARVRPTGAQGVLTFHLDDTALDDIVGQCRILRDLQASSELLRVRSDAIAHLLLLLSCLARAACKNRTLTTHQEIAQAGPAARAVAAIEDDLTREWNLDELCELASLQRSHFVRRFRRATGLSPIAYIARRRAEKAAVLLLTTDLPVAEIGRRVGWEDPNYFARRFRQAFGTNAREYREQLPTPALARDGEDWIQW